VSLPDYIREDSQWALVKLHGSVDWMRLILNDPPSGDIPGDSYLANYVAAWGEDLKVADDITRRTESVDSFPPVERMRGEPRSYFYPALSVPLGPDDELNCPPEHVDFARRQLEAADGLHILSVGYSGLDSGLLDLLRASNNHLRSLLAINHDGTAAFGAATRIASAFETEATPEMALPGDFNDFVWGGGLEDHLDSLK
jgi:hypothetical protein